MMVYLLPIYNEIRKGLLLIWDYKFSMFLQIVTFGMVFLGITFLMGDGAFVPERVASALVGYMIWFLATLAINDMSWNLQEEAQTGTLEQMFMTVAPTGILVLGRVLARILFSIVTVGIMGALLIFLLRAHLVFSLGTLLPLGLTLVGLFGFGYMVAGAALIFKQVGTLAGMMVNMLLFINGSLLPVEKMPHWLATFARLLPTTEGIIVLRQMTLHGLTVADVWAAGSLQSLILHSVVLVILGWWVFAWCERRARHKGTLGQY